MRWATGLGLAAAAWVSQTLPLRAACLPVVAEHPLEGANHLSPCEATSYQTNPPSSGNHYFVWASYKTYTAPVALGYLVHNLEHGAIVVGYNCPGGCQPDVAKLQAWIDSRPVDSLCEGLPSQRRMILAPNPFLDVKFAASAWLWTWKADSADTASLSAFADAHYGRASEDLCNAGNPDVTTTCPVTATPVTPGSACNTGVIEGPRPAAGRVTRGMLKLWSGSLPERVLLRIEASGADGRRIEARATEAGPGPAEAVWDAGAFRRRHPGTGAVALRVTAEGRHGSRVLASRVERP
jgi:hypothetical protein